MPDELVNSSLFAQLETLDLANNQIGPQGALILAQIDYPVALKRLNLSGNQLTRSCMDSISTNPHLQMIEILNV